jgi:hypothetical protein
MPTASANHGCKVPPCSQGADPGSTMTGRSTHALSHNLRPTMVTTRRGDMPADRTSSLFLRPLTTTRRPLFSPWQHGTGDIGAAQRH